METNFIAHYGYIFRQYFLAFLILIIFSLILITPIGDLYHQNNNLTIASTTTTLLLIPILIFFPIFIKNGTKLTLNTNGITIKYPFSTNKKTIYILWSDVLKIEKDSKQKIIYIITKATEVYALDQKLWYCSSENLATINPSLEESYLYQEISKNFSISETKSIDYNTYKNNFSIFYGNNFSIIFIPFFIIACMIFYNFHDLTNLKTRNFLIIMNLCFLWSLLGLLILSFIRIKDIRFINAISIKSMIYSIYLTGFIICAAHQYSIDNIAPKNIVYKLQESSDYRQIWATEEDLPNIVIYSYSYPQHHFLYNQLGTKQQFRIIHGVLDSYDVLNSDIYAILSTK